MLYPLLAAVALVSSTELRFGRVELSTGVRIHYAEQGDSTGPTVILLHGYSDSWYSFSRILPLLPERYRVFALDQRGHGESGTPAEGYAPRDLAADVLAFMTAKGIARATIVGHSMGSLVAQQVAAAAPHRVSGLILIGSGTTVRRIEGTASLQAAVAGFTDPVPLDFIREFQLSTIHVPVPDAFLARVIDESRRLSAATWQALLDGMMAMDPVVALRNTPIPTLLLWGELDAVFALPERDALTQLLGTARRIDYAETGHAPHWERPGTVARDLVSWLDRDR
jgi:pimeloyl-ACP methyl ester carboxylesterase